MSEPTAGERALAGRLRLEASKVAAARDVINAVAALPWPRPERVSLLARLARAGKADVGAVYGGMAIDAAPIEGLDVLVPMPGIGYKRVAGLARALADVDINKVDTGGVRLREAMATIAGLRGENEALRTELDRLRAQTPTGPAPLPSPSVMALADLASSVGVQATAVDDLLRSRANGLRLGSVDLRLTGTGTAAGGDVALDLASPSGGSAIGLSFVPAGSQPAADEGIEVPDVVGYTTALARRKLAARHFAVSVAAVASASGIVAAQTPAANTRAASGSVVRVIVR